MAPKETAKKAASEKSKAAPKTANPAIDKSKKKAKAPMSDAAIAKAAEKKKAERFAHREPTAKEMEEANEHPFLTVAAVHRFLHEAFKARTGHENTRFSKDYVLAVRAKLCELVRIHLLDATMLSLYRGMKSTDYRAIDLATIMKHNIARARRAIVYKKSDAESGIKLAIEAARDQ